MIICDRLVAPFISSKDRSFAVALQTLGPLVAERLAKEDELGPDWPGKPVRFPSETNDQITSGSYVIPQNDLISWLLEDAEGEERTVPALVLRVLSTNFAAIHTSSMVCSFRSRSTIQLTSFIFSCNPGFHSGAIRSYDLSRTPPAHA